MTTPAPIRREVRVSASPARAFHLFTAHIGAWWPLDDLSVLKGTVAFEGEKLVERSGADESVWAEVTEWNAPHGFSLSWHAGQEFLTPTRLSVSFSPDGDGTLVLLVHDGWEALADPAAAAEYGEGWPVVLGRFAHVAGEAASDGDRWFALQHLPGPSLPEGASIFAHPAFREHLAFLGRLEALGVLEAAGPLTDEDGEGMTIVRIRPEHGDLDIESLATTDDLSVAGGFLTVRVRPWNVMLTR